MHKIMKSVLVCSFHRYSILKRDKTFSEGSVMCICKAAGVNLCMVVKNHPGPQTMFLRGFHFSIKLSCIGDFYLMDHH